MGGGGGGKGKKYSDLRLRGRIRGSLIRLQRFFWLFGVHLHVKPET